MLKRVEAEEAALMSDIDPQRLGLESPSSRVMSPAEGYPLSNSQDSTESAAAPAEVGLTYGANDWHGFAAGPAPLPSKVSLMIQARGEESIFWPGQNNLGRETAFRARYASRQLASAPAIMLHHALKKYSFTRSFRAQSLSTGLLD